MGEQPDKQPQENLDELPEHERRDEGPIGGGLTGSGISAEQRGPVRQDVIEAQEDDQPEMDPDEPPPAYRVKPG